MGHEEIVELDELKDSCHHLMDIENKLIKDLQTLSKSHNEQQNDDKQINKICKQLIDGRDKLDEFRKSALIISDKIY